MLTFLKEYSRVALRGNIPAVTSFHYYKRWRKLLGTNPINEKLPWITFRAIDFIEKNLKSSDKVFEYGGGGSTLFFLDRVAKVVTVEHNQEWFTILQEKIGVSNKSRWQGQLILPEKPIKVESFNRADPFDYSSGDPEFQNITFRAYSKSICQFGDEYFDMVLIDGRARTSCLFHAMPKVKVGGYLLLDNSERKYYLQHNAKLLQKNYKLLLDETAPVPYSAFFSKTSIWERVR